MSRDSSSASALRDLFEQGTIAGLSDEQLLGRFVSRRAESEAAFAALVDRHGPMVWGVCQRVLGGRIHEAEDAFQATFLVLARRADAIRVDGSLGRWLHGVASKVATRARAQRLERPEREARATRAGTSNEVPDLEQAELLAALDEELERLPEKYRSPLVLCHLEGLTYDSAAERLGCPPGAIKGRLSRARELLRDRLTRRGVSPTDSTLATLLASTPRLTVPPALARLVLTRPVTEAGLATAALILANGVTRTMLMIRWAKILIPTTSATAGLLLLIPQPTPRAVAPQAQAKAPAPQSAIAPADDPANRSTAIAVPLPPKDDLRQLLRQAASEAKDLAVKHPKASSWTLTSIAKAQALVGDLAGAKETFAAAIVEKGSEPGSRYAGNLADMAHEQIKVGLRDDARTTILRALEKISDEIVDQQQVFFTLQVYKTMVGDLVSIGAQDEARRVTGRLQAFAAKFSAKTNISNPQDIVAPAIVESLAAIGDFEGSFHMAKSPANAELVLGEAARSAACHLDRDQARKFVEEAERRLLKLRPFGEPYGGMHFLAEAQTLIGDIEGAKKSARSIGVGATQANFGLTDNQVYAMHQIARIQEKAGQIDAARETMREAYQIVIDHPRIRNPEFLMVGIAGAQATLGDIEGALRSIEAMPEKSQAETQVKSEWSTTIASVARAQALAGQGENARETMNRALAHARLIAGSRSQPKSVVKQTPPDSNLSILELTVVSRSGTVISQSVNMITNAKLAEIQSMAGDATGAMKTAGAIEDDDWRRSALKQITSARALAGDVQGAIALANQKSQSADDRRAALEGVGEGVERRLLLHTPNR